MDTLGKMKKAIFILKDHFRSMPFLDYILFIRNSLFRNERILVYCIFLQKYAIYNKNSNLPIVKGEIKDLECERIRLEQQLWEFQCDRYDGVKDFFLYIDEGIIGHISWLYYKGDPNRLLRLSDEDCEIKFCLTLPKFRGKGLYPAVLQEIQWYLKDKGLQRCFICVKDDNCSSIRGIEKAGFLFVCEITLRKIFGFQVSQKCDTSRLRII